MNACGAGQMCEQRRAQAVGPLAGLQVLQLLRQPACASAKGLLERVCGAGKAKTLPSRVVGWLLLLVL